jgi:hypothetical protein
MDTNKYMKHFPSQERLIIPIGVLTKIPEVLADIQGLNLTDELTPFLLEEETLNNKEQFLTSIATQPTKNPFSSLFNEIFNINPPPDKPISWQKFINQMPLGHLEKFLSPSRHESDSVTARGYGRMEEASHGAEGLFRC